jgi:hypothetical protein
VDCTAGESVNAAIAAGHDPITINGVCDENVVIDVDGITLLAGGPGAGFVPSGGDAALELIGAVNAEISGLTFDGTNTSNYSVYMRHSDAIFQNVTVTGGKAAGIMVNINSSANVQGSLLTGNNTALTVINNSYCNVTGETRIENSKFIGIISSRASSVTFGGGSVIDGVDNGEGVGLAASAHFLVREHAQITNVNGPGINVSGSTLEISEGSITGVTSDAIRVSQAGSVEIDRGTITGNGGNGIDMKESSGGLVFNSDLSGNTAGALNVAADSVLTDGGGNTF